MRWKCMDLDYSLLITITVNIMTFSMGSCSSWSSSVIEKMKNGDSDSPFDHPISTEEASWISSSGILGAIFGPFIFGPLSDRIGRKYTILASAFPMILHFIMMICFKPVVIFYIARFMAGTLSGGVMTVIPMYVGEIASPHNRGALSSLSNLFINAGILLSYILGPDMSFMTFNIVLAVIPAVFLVTFFFIGTETPYYYVKKDEISLAEKTLKKLRGKNANIENELKLITKTLEEEGNGTILDIFASRELRKAALIGLGLMLFPQLSGILGIQFYAQSIFKQAGVNVDAAICSIIFGAVQLTVSVSTPLFVDRLGRKKLLLISAVGVFISEGALGIFSTFKDHNYDVSSLSIFPLICILCYIVVYNVGFGPMSWVILGEIFPSNVKTSATLMMVFSASTFGFFVTKYFQILTEAVGMGATFLIFTAFTAISIPFAKFILIETKGKTFNEIREKLSR